MFINHFLQLFWLYFGLNLSNKGSLLPVLHTFPAKSPSSDSEAQSLFCASGGEQLDLIERESEMLQKMTDNSR